MIIYAPDNSVLLDVPILPESVHTEELMKTDEVTIVWNSDSNDTLPEGAFIELLDGRPTTLGNGEKYYLLEPYSPEQKKENHWKYQPVFKSFFFSLSKVPFYMYSYEDEDVTKEITSREPDWSLTDYAHNFLSTLCRAIYNETGVWYDSAVASDLTEFKTVPFNAVDIISALNAIASAFETEFWLEKNPHGNYVGTIHLSFAKNGAEKTLTVGENINVPSVSENDEGYYNRFIPLGSTRNIVQDYKGANVNSIASKRLTLDPTQYPNGYIDFSNGGKVYTKILQFDDIYPSATNLVVTNIMGRTMYELDDDGEKVPIGTSGGGTIYSQYTIWYFQLKVKNGSTYTDFQFDETTYDKDTNPNGMVLPGLVPSIHFNSGPLNGRDFEVIYHKDTGHNNPEGKGETGAFTWPADCFEIVFTREGKYIIPDMSSLIPVQDNQVVLFNVRTPQEYYADAYLRLKEAAFKEIGKNYIQLVNHEPVRDSSGNIMRVDKNSYQFNSNAVEFNENNPDLKIGDAVSYTNNGYTLSTRVTGLETRLDFPIKQSITIGNEITRGTLQELKEEAVNANTNIDLLASLQNASQQVLDAYNRTQQMILNGLADDFFEENQSLATLVQLKSSYSYIGTRKGLVFDTEADPTNSPAHLMVINKGTAQNPVLALYSPLPLITGGDQIVIDGDPQGGSGGGGATMLRQLEDVYHNASSVLRKNGGSVANGDLLSFDSAGNRWVALDQSTITPDLSNYYTKAQTDTEISSAITALNLGAASTYGVGSVASGNTGLVTGGDVWTAIDNLPEPMVFKGSLGEGGTISSLPAASSANEGFTYKVITAGTYRGTAAKVGDTFISNGSSWILIPSGDEPEGTVTSVGLTMPTGFSVGSSPITSSGTLAVTFASGYSLPTTAKQTNWDAVYGYFSNGILPYNHGGTGISSYTKGNIIYASANNTLAKLAPNTGTKQFLTMTSSVPSWGDVDETDVFGSSAIGSSSLPVYYTGSALATITSLDLLSKNTGYIKGNRFYLTSDIYFYTESVGGTTCVRLNAPFITAGDQIVISGTPGGGGGGGGATTLAGLDDTSISNPQSGQMLSWNGTKWVNTNAPTGSITSVSLAAGATNGTLHLVVNGTAQSDVAVTGLKALAYKDSLAFSEITGTASASQIPNLSWSKITSDKPTTLSGYGIADALLVFNAKAASQTWGNQTGTFITGANDSTGGSIAFRRDNPVEGQMSMVIDGTVYVKEGNNRVLDTGDVGSTVASQTSLANYLPLTGGTLEKNDGNILNINSTSTAGHNYMYFKVGGTSKASVGYYSGLAYVANETTYARIGVNDSGTPQYWSSQRSSTAQTLLHTGNYASFLNSVYHPYGGGNIAFQTSTLAASGQVTITGNWSSGTAGLVVANNTSDSIPWLINSLAPNMPVGGFGGGIIFGKADSAYNTGVLSFYYAGAESTSNYVGIGLYNHDNLLKVYGTGVTEVQSLKIGSATITWNSNGYLHIDKPIVTAGDQIVISGTPGGGGGGGATTLAGLDDVAITSVADGQLLQYNGSKWVNVAASSVGGVTSVAGRTGAITLTTSDITNIETWISGKGYITSYTDTKNTTGADNTTSKIFLVGPTAQTTSNGSARTYSNSNCYASGGYLYSGGSQVLTSHQTLYNLVINNSAGTAQITYKPGTSGTYALTLTKAMVGLGNVENTALSTWAGASSITTLGTITTGVWHGSAIGNSYLANSSITINGSSTSLGGSFSTASITAGTAGQSGASTGVSFSIPYVTMNKYGIVTAYGTHTHTISASDLTTTIGSKTYAAYHSAGYVKKDGDTMSGNLTIVGMTTSGTITSTVATGTAPLSVTSTTVVSNLNADLLDGQHGSYYAAASSVSTLQGYFTHGSAKAARSLASLGADSGYWYDTEYPIIAQWDDLTHVRLKCTNAAGTVSYDVRVSAADKFVTSRTLWGQSFDGTADVTGAMSSVTNIDSLLYFNTTNSRVGVGVSSPSYAFHCAGDICTNTYLRINAWSGYGSGSAAFWYNGNTSTLALDKGLSVTGTFVSTGDQVVSSDLTLKENLTPVTYSVSDIANARAVEFDWKDGRGHSMGSIAQDWLGIAPALVHGEEGNMSLAYGQLALVNTILLARQSESHEERIKELEARVSELEMENKRLRMN